MSFKSFDLGADLSGRLGQALGTGLKQGYDSRMKLMTELLKKGGSGQLRPEEAAQITETLISKGFDPQLAQLYPYLTEGGKTKAGEFGLEEIIRRNSQPQSEGVVEDFDEVREEIPLSFKRKPSEEVKRAGEFEKRAYERNKPYFERLSKQSSNLPREKLALTQMKAAIKDDDFNSFRNSIAEMTGLDALKTSTGQVVNSAVKTFLISELGNITGRPNQFIEKQITKAAISPLYKKEANEAIFEGLNLVSQLKEREIQIAEDLEERYLSQGKEIPRTFQKQVKEKLKKESNELEKNYEDYINKLFTSKSKKKGEVEMIAPDGSTYAIPKKDVSSAQKSGYRLKRR